MSGSGPEEIATEPLASRSGRPTVRVASAEPRILGVVPPILALVFGVAGVTAGLVLLLSGSALAGAVLLVSGACMVALAIDAARRWPASALPRMAVGAADAMSARLGLARTSASAWSQASREVIILRRELRLLRSERSVEQSALGDAAYRQDTADVDELRERLGEIDEQIEGREAIIAEVIGQARERVHRKRAAVQPTQPIAVAENAPARAEQPDRTAPTAVRRGRTSPTNG